MTQPTRVHHSAGLTAGATSILLAVAGCAPAGSGAGDGERIEGGTITYAHYQEPPCLWGGWVQQAYTSRQVFDSLVSYGDDGEIVPWLAVDWEESDDRKMVTFTLREDVDFTDGTHFDAHAVEANFPNWQAGIGWHPFTYIIGAEAVDDYTVEIHLEEPNPELYNILANGHYGIQSPEALEHNSDEENCLRPVGTGPWVVEEWARGEGISFVRNENYNSPPENASNDGAPYVERVEWKFVPDATARWGALATGEADIIYDVPPAQWATAEQEFQVLNFVATGRPQGFSFNVERGPFTDKEVRQAFVHAVDRQALVETVFQGSVPFEGNGSLSKSTPLYLDLDDTYPYDLDRANQLLDEAGWTERDADGYRVKNGEPLEVRLPFNNDIVHSTGAIALQTIQDQVRGAGFKVELIPLTQTEGFSGAYSAPDEKELSFGYWVWPSPNILDIVYRAQLGDARNGNNTSFFNDPEIEEQILDAQREPDPALREEKYAQLQQWFQDEAIAVGVYNFTYNVAISRDLHGVWQDQGNGLLNFNDAYFVE